MEKYIFLVIILIYFIDYFVNNCNVLNQKSCHQFVDLIGNFVDRYFYVTFLFFEGSPMRGSERRGYISINDIASLVAPSICEYVCICGPSGFNDKIKQMLVDAGHVDEKTIYVW